MSGALLSGGGTPAVARRVSDALAARNAASVRRSIEEAGGLPTTVGIDLSLFTEARVGAVFNVIDRASVQMGIGGQRAFCHPEEDLVVATFGSHPVAGNALTVSGALTTASTQDTEEINAVSNSVKEG